MTRQDFFGRIYGMFGSADIDNIARAYSFAKETHRVQKPRDGGERYFEHCRRVVVQILDWGYCDAQALIIGLLHDCEEDGFLAPDAIRVFFGDEIADAVSTLSKTVPVYDRITRRIIHREKKSLDVYFAAVAAADWRVRVVKCADRIDNLSSMGVWKEKRQQRYTRETEMYIMPIAEALGQGIADELRALFVR